MTNDTPDGRLLLEVAWLEQEIGRGRLPMSVGANTVFYLVGSGELNHIPGVQGSLGRLDVVLKGIGLIKSRHIPVLISMIDDLYADAHAVWAEVPAGEREVMEDLRAQVRRFDGRAGRRPICWRGATTDWPIRYSTRG